MANKKKQPCDGCGILTTDTFTANRVMIEHREETGFVRLDYTRRGTLAERFVTFASPRVVGQSRMIEAVAEILELAEANFHDGKKPRAKILFAGPAGVGKTEMVKVFTEFLFGDQDAMTRVDCSEYAESHRVSRFIGSPDGYVGFREEPKITQHGLDAPGFRRRLAEFFESLSTPHLRQIRDLQLACIKVAEDIESAKNTFNEGTINEQRWKESATKWENKKREIDAALKRLGFPEYNPNDPEGYWSVVLFDELERAHRAFYNLLYPILDEGYLSITGYQNPHGPKGRFVRRLSFRNSFIFGTSNLGHEEIRELLDLKQGKRTGMKFYHTEGLADNSVDEHIYRQCRDAVTKYFEPSFLRRFDHLVVARPFGRAELRMVIDVQIADLFGRLAKEWKFPVLIEIREDAREFIADKSSDDPTKGASIVEQKIKKYLARPLASLRATEQAVPGDHLVVVEEARDGERTLQFYKINAPQGEQRILHLS